VHVLIAVLFVALFLSGTYFAVAVNSDFGELEVKTVSIEDAGKQLSGLMYIPYAVSPENPCPAIVLAHGISESKDMMSNLGLELARRGFTVLCLDLIGHGSSSGTVSEGNNEIDFGVSAAVQYLQAQPYINSSDIGLVGHSLGGGAVRAEAAQNKNILAIVLVAGGIGADAQNPKYGVLTSTFPKNLLVIVGKYDVLFNVTDLETKELPTAFNSSGPVVPDIIYGSFELQTARKLVIPATTHLFEPIDPKTVAEIVNWMENSLGTNQASKTGSNVNIVYPEREVALLLALIGLIGITLMSYYPIARFISEKNTKSLSSVRNRASSRWKIRAVWGLLNLVLFFPMVLIGFAISFPPLIFGSSIAWWVLVTGLVGILMFAKNKPKLWEAKPELKKTFRRSFSRNGTVVAILLFVVLFTVSSLIQAFFTIDLRIMAPLFQELTQPRRVLAFAAFVPFFLAYFLAEGVYLHDPEDSKTRKEGSLTKIGEWAQVVFAKISPFLILIVVQYLPKLILNVWVLPSFLGFIAEFLWLIVPIFVLTTTCSWWFYNKTATTGTGAIFNALILAWVAAVVFPC
jgi:dienelactone hydrolase